MPFADADAFRLEPEPVDPSLVEGLRAAIADPAWLLARQLQFGEFDGEDAGSPAAATLWTRPGRLTRVLGRSPNGSAGMPLEATGAPLEARVEAEWEGPSAHVAALAGQHFLRQLATAGTRDSLEAYRAALRGLYGLEVTTGDDPLLALAPGRALDGARLYAAFKPALDTGRLPAEPPVTGSDDIAAVSAAGQALVAYFEAVTGRDVPASGAWVPPRLEYQLTVAGPVGGDELVLAATEYDSGTLDWFSFDVAPGATLDAGGDLPPEDPVATTFLPSPVGFRGMPAARLWQIEDEGIDYGAVEAGPEDIAAMLVVEFTLRYGNDFFLVPLPLASGEIVRVAALVVTDTFGRRDLIPAASEIDPDFRVFEHAVAPGEPRETAIVMFPTAVSMLESPPVEAVTLVRDEAANLCWAVERIAPGPDGLPVDRSRVWSSSRPTLPPPGPVPPGDQPPVRDYTPRSEVPDNWFAMLPAGDPPTGLRVVALRALPGQPAPAPPWGRVIGELTSTGAAQEEITRATREVVRGFQYARGLDGRQSLWLGRRVGAAQPTGGPGIRFDDAR
jgi:hypothetical protein